MSYCTNCGTKLEEGQTECSNCGEKIEAFISDPELINKPLKLNGKFSSLKRYITRRNIIILAAAIIFICGLGTISYSKVIKPQRVEKHISLANKYLDSGNYKEAVLEFLNAIKIEPKSVPARIGLAKAYIKLKNLDAAEKVLLEAREIDKMNAEVLLLLNDIWREKKPIELYQAFAQYMKLAVAPNINAQVKKIYEDMIAKPSVPVISIPGGKYAQGLSVAVTIDNIKPGYTCYYTLDGSNPSKNNGVKYTKPISIGQGHTILNVVAVNVVGVSGEKAAAEYDIDIRYKDKLVALIKEAQTEYVNAQEGTEPGKYLAGSKAEFLPFIQAAKAAVENASASQPDIDSKFSALNNALVNFRKKKIPQTNKANLKNEITKAKKLVQDSTEGQKDGQVKPGSKATLNKAIEEAQKVVDDMFATQQTIDTAVKNLKNAEAAFEKNRVKLIVNPDGTNFTYGYKTLMGDSTNKTFNGTFKVIRTGTAILYSGNKSIYSGDTGTITVQLTRQNNSVTTYAKLTWNKDLSYIYTMGQWYAEYNGSTQTFKLYPSGNSNTNKMDGTYINGVMKGKMYINGVGYCIDFTAK